MQRGPLGREGRGEVRGNAFSWHATIMSVVKFKVLVVYNPL